MKTLPKNRIIDYLKANHLMEPNQHGFTVGRSCQNDLIDLFEVLDEGGAVDMAFGGAFDTYSHKELMDKLVNIGLKGVLCP